jgi:hypothetical protein
MNADEFKRECARRRDAGLVLGGDTYMVRGGIKAEGGIWDRRLGAWLLPDMGAWCRASALVASQAPRGSQGVTTAPASAASSQRGASAARGGGTASLPGGSPEYQGASQTRPVPSYQGQMPAVTSRVSQTPQGRRGARPCGYPGCNPPAYCDECEGEGAITEHRRAF